MSPSSSKSSSIVMLDGVPFVRTVHTRL
jgi:hypothetical protein